MRDDADLVGEGRRRGIVLELDASFPTLTMTALSWGDKDGLGIGKPDPVTHITPAAGYVGLKDLVIDNLTVNGKVSSNQPACALEVLVLQRIDRFH